MPFIIYKVRNRTGKITEHVGIKKTQHTFTISESGMHRQVNKINLALRIIQFHVFMLFVITRRIVFCTIIRTWTKCRNVLRVSYEDIYIF